MPTGHRFTYWQEPDGTFLGYPEEFPDYMTQGATLEELQDNIADILRDLLGEPAAPLACRARDARLRAMRKEEG